MRNVNRELLYGYSAREIRYTCFD